MSAEDDRPARGGAELDEGERRVDESRPVDDGQLVEITSATWVGPLPPPAVLAQYKELSPDLAERIVVMAEVQGQHRRDMERSVLEAEVAGARGNLDERRLGQWLGFTIGTVAIVAGAIVIALGHDWAGGALGVSGVAGLAAVFVQGRRGDRSEAPDE